MSDCHGGYWESEICLTPKEDFCCGTVENFMLAPKAYYKHNTPLFKSPDMVGVYVPWQPGMELCAISRCEADLTNATEPCPASVCTGVCCGTLIDPKAICWPEGTTKEDIEKVRCDSKCCLKIAQATECC